MKTEYSKSNLIDSIAASSVLAALLVAIVGTLVNSPDARAEQTSVQQMEAIVVTAPRVEIVKLDTIVVTASRDNSVLLASN